MTTQILKVDPVTFYFLSFELIRIFLKVFFTGRLFYLSVQALSRYEVNRGSYEVSEIN